MALQPAAAHAEWVGLSTVTVSKITRNSATLTASITTDARGSGTLVPGFFVRIGGEQGGFVLAAGSPTSVPAAGNATTTYSATSTGLQCGRKYDVSASYVKDPDANGVGTAGVLDSRVTSFTTWSCTVPELSDLEALRYIASHPDLIAVFGPDAAKGRQHYLDWGFAEGRRITFEPLNYVASHPDLIAAFGADEEKAVRHFIDWGSREGRRTTWTDIDSLRYIASHPDLIEAFGADRLKGVRHYIQWGYKEARRITFSELDALRYVASHPDLILAVGSSVEGALRHFIANGYREGRKIVFDPAAYLAVSGNADLRAAFAADLVAATAHYINSGFREGRQKLASLKPPGFVASLASVDFGKQLVGAAVSRDMSLRNSGEETLLLESVRLGSNASSEFSVRSACGSLLAPGASCTVSLTFKPADRGVESTTLTIAHNAAGRASSFALSAQGIAPVIVASATTIDFGTQAVNSESPVRRVTFRNDGDATWDFGAHYLNGNDADVRSFNVGANCSGLYGKAEPGEACYLDVRFTPKSAGAFVATAQIGFEPIPGGSLVLRGTGTGPGFTLSPERLTFPDQPSGSTGQPRNVLISNPGDAPLKLTELTVIGDDAAQFSLSQSCTEVPAGGRCVVAVSFKPTSVGAKRAQIRVRHNSPSGTGGSATADLVASAVEAAALLGVSPRSLEFPPQALDTSSVPKTLRVTNRGSKPLAFTAISMVADDPEEFSRTHDCGSTLAPAASCDISVVFRPRVAGARSARLSIGNDAETAPTFVALSGVGGTTSTNELVCGPTLSSFAAGSSLTDADLDIRNTPDGKGFLVRLPAWTSEDYALRDRTAGFELMISRDTPQYAARQIFYLDCPTVRLIDADNFDNKPDPCDVDVGDVLAAPADTLFRFTAKRWQRSPIPSATIRYVTSVRLGKAQLVPPVLSGDAGNGQVTLAWPAVAGATAYRVVRFMGDDIETLVERTTALSVTLTAANDQPRSYAVRAINDQHESGLSNSVRLTPGSSPLTSIGIDEIQVLQSIQPAGDGSVPLIAGKPGIVRVHFSVSGSSDGKAGIVRLSKAGETPIDIRGPILDSPSGSTTAASCVATFDLRDAASRWFSSGDVDLTVEVDHGESLVASSSTRKQRSRKFNFVPQKPIHVKLVPVTTDFGTPSDAEMTTSKTEIGALLNAMYPNASVYVETAETALAWGTAIRPFAINDWGRAITALGSMRAAELNNRNCDRFYYGVFKNVSVKTALKEYLGIGGLATYPSESSLFGCPPLYAIGVLHDSFDLSSRGIAAHEIGHLHQLQHISTAGETNDVCGDALGNDQSYPHAKGRIGVTGYDARRHRMLQSTLQHDFMGYCRRSWVSDYHYKKLRNFQELLFDSQAVASASGREMVAANAGLSGGVLLTGLARSGMEGWELMSMLRLDGARGMGEAAATLEASVDFGNGETRRYPVVIHDLDHVTAKVFEVWIPGEQAPWRVQIRKHSGELMFDWNSGRSETRSDFESSQAAAVAAREIDAGTWVLEPWTWGPRMLIRIRDGVRTFVGNDDGTAGLRFEAQQGDLVEVLATRLGTRVIVTLGAGEGVLAAGEATLAAVAAGLPPGPATPTTLSVVASLPAAVKPSSAAASGSAKSDPVVSPNDEGVSGLAISMASDAAGSSYRLLRRDEPGGRQSWRLEYLSSGEQRIAVRELTSSAAVVWRVSESTGPQGKSLPSSGWVLACGAAIWAVRDGYSLDIDRAASGLGAAAHFQRNLDASAAEALLVSGANCSAGGGLTITGFALPVDAHNPAAIAATTAALAFVLRVGSDGATEGLETRAATLDFDQLCAAPVAGGRREFCQRLRELRGR